MGLPTLVFGYVGDRRRCWGEEGDAGSLDEEVGEADDSRTSRAGQGNNNLVPYLRARGVSLLNLGPREGWQEGEKKAGTRKSWRKGTRHNGAIEE